MSYPTYGYDPRSELPDKGENPFKRYGWWTNNNALGDTKQVIFPPSAGQVISVASADELAGPMPRSVTLQRQILYPPSGSGSGANCDVRAQVTFGSGAASQAIICDWNPGTQLDFAGNAFVRVDALTYTPDPNNPYNSGVAQPGGSIASAEIKLAVSIGMTGGPHPPPRFTQRLPTIQPGSGSGIIVPPPWAHAVQLTGGSNESGSIYVADIELEWIAPDGLPFALYTGDELNPQQFLPIPAGSRLQVNNNKIGTENIALIWELAL